MDYSSIAYATTATRAAVVDDSPMSFSALCSAVPQIPASAVTAHPDWDGGRCQTRACDPEVVPQV